MEQAALTMMQHIEPALRIALGNGAAPTDISILPGGDAAQVVLVDWGLDLGILIGWHLPYLLAPVALAALVWIAMRVHRLWRQRSLDRGQPHCARCGYLLMGIAAPDCPECGTALSPKGILRPRPVRRRIAAWLGAAGLVLALYLLLWVPGLRYTFLPRGTSWRSATIGRWVLRHDMPYLSQFVRYRSRVVEIELRDGGRRRLLHTEDLRCITSLSILPEAGAACLRDSWGEVSVHQWPGYKRIDTGYVPWDATSQSLVEPRENRISYTRRDGTLVSTDYKTGVETRIKLEQFFTFPSNQWIVPRGHVWLIPFSDGTIGGLRDNKHFKRWRRQTGELLGEFRLSVGVMANAATSTDNEFRAYISTYDPHTRQAGPIRVWDIEAAALVETIRAPAGEAIGHLGVTPGGHYLFAAPFDGSPQAVWVRDLTSNQWIARLDTSTAGAPGIESLVIGRDKVVTMSGRPGTGFTLLVFDTPQFADAAADEQGAP